ncbi:tripartite tricarboxylate transporter substrate binding protein [Microvirga antarctica]|uniref:tripartite tricarboxylate transporter substrate binding protein n=1 Tax=Microvirga antarctica TaxID=2819233 RepID=UPI001B3084D9|nr:tripartite tricarboxylate transporter substrate binding protein [Microvirga antarctica]
MKLSQIAYTAAMLTLSTLGMQHQALAQDASSAYPTKPIRLIVPFAPGGSTDLVARLVAANLSKSLGQQVVVENHGGGGTVIGTQMAANAPADGYTLLLGSTTLSINPGLRNDLPYDTMKAFQPISNLSRIPYVLVASPKAGVKTIAELLAKAKAEPGAINVGSPGVGSGGHLASELFEMLAGVDFEHVPYKGTGPAMTDLLGGQIDLLFGTILSVMPHIQSGALIPLAISTGERSASLPDLPTIAESGVPGYEASSWNSLLVPAGTPAPIVDRLNGDIRKALQSPDVVKALEQDGARPNPTTPDEFRAYLGNEIEKWRKVIKTANIRPE